MLLVVLPSGGTTVHDSKGHAPKAVDNVPAITFAGADREDWS
jgi:hypothetical protein